jgi:hypothetical protein
MLTFWEPATWFSAFLRLGWKKKKTKLGCTDAARVGALQMAMKKMDKLRKRELIFLND